MTVTLFDLTYRVAVDLGGLQEGLATGGSTSTLVDTAGLVGLDNDLFNLGTLWIPKTTDSLAPQGQFKQITDFVASTKTVTIASVMTATIGSGDTYAINKKRYPLSKIIQKINQVLATAGKVPVEDITTTTVLDQREYTLPAAASLDLRQVWLETDPNRDLWMPLYNWEMVYTAGGTADKVLIHHNFIDSDVLKFIYVSPHAQLRAYGDVLNEVIHPDRIIFKAAADLMTEFMDRTRQYQYKETRNQLLIQHERAIASTPRPVLPKKNWYRDVWPVEERWYIEAR
jgi:hypothetical protein